MQLLKAEPTLELLEPLDDSAQSQAMVHLHGDVHPLLPGGVRARQGPHPSPSIRNAVAHHLE